MGGNSTKINGEYLPSTPNNSKCFTNDDLCLQGNEDPRSPTIYRTPINQIKKITSDDAKRNFLSTPIEKHNPNGILKVKLMKMLGYNLQDPRSPSAIINRTPILAYDSNSKLCEDDNDGTINLNDTFSDLDKEIKTNTNKNCMELAFDPRSPTIGVNRTPIVLSDSIHDEDNIETEFDKSSIETKNAESFKSSQNIIKPNINQKPSKQIIYEDNEQVFSPKRNENFPGLRTPLGGLENIIHFPRKARENYTKKRLLISSHNHSDGNIIH